MPETIHFKHNCSYFSTAGGMGAYGFGILIGKAVFTEPGTIVQSCLFFPPQEVLQSTALLAILFKEQT